MAMIRPMLMGICEVNDWGQPWEQIKNSPVSQRQHSARNWGLHAAGGEGDIASLKGFTIFYFEFWEGPNARLLLWLRSPSDYQEETSSANRFFFFFIIATNWKTIHHINIIAVFQKMEKPNKTTLIYFFLPRYWTTLIFTCSDETGLVNHSLAIWLHNKERFEHLLQKKK